MRFLKKLAAAVAVIMAVSALAACGDDSPAAIPQDSGLPGVSKDSPEEFSQNSGSPDVSKDSGGAANNIATALEDQTVKSEITSVDINAKELVGTVSNWILDNRYAGGEDKEPCELTIIMSNGSATVKDSSDKNDWNARENCPEGLKERIESDYPDRTFTAKVFINDSGYAVYSWLVRDDADYTGAAPSREDFEAGVYGGWKPENREGMTAEGVIIGTCPKLHYKNS